MSSIVILIFCSILLSSVAASPRSSTTTTPTTPTTTAEQIDMQNNHSDIRLLYPDYNEGEEYFIDDDEDEAEISVNSDLPNFVTKGGEVYGQAGQPLQLPCQVNQLGGRNMIWMKENDSPNPEHLFIVGKKMVEDEVMSLKRLDGEEGTVLVISELKSEHAGNYTCRIADENVTGSLTFQLTIITKSEMSHLTANESPLLYKSSCLLLFSILYSCLANSQ